MLHDIIARMEAFIEISLILAIATVMAVVMQQLRLPLILGHIMSGILVGPAVLNILHAESTLEIFSQFGITALLFIVGLSLSPHVIREVGRVSVVTGLGQIIFTSLVGFLIGRGLGFGTVEALYIAIALTFSSTIIILKLLSDRRDLGKLYGKIAIGFLLVQDIAAMLILILVTSTAQGADALSSLTDTLLRSVVVVAALVFISIFVLPRLTRMFAASQEFLFLFSVGWGIGLAALFFKLGLSIEIGALAAGVCLASSPYHHEISAKMKLLRDFFIVMFFILLGAGLELSSLASMWRSALVFSVFVLLGNPLIVMILMGLMGYTKKTSFYAGLTVAQISEFSFILILLASKMHHVRPEIITLITAVGVTTITISTLFILYADYIYKFFEKYLSIFEKNKPYKEKICRLKYDALLFGCHRVGRDFMPTLRKMKMKFLVIDFDPAVIGELQDKKIPVLYGDAQDNELLDELNFEDAKLVICTLPDFDANRLILSKALKVNSKATVLTTAHTLEQANILYREGSAYVILPHFLGGNYTAMLVEKFGHDKKKFALERKKHLAHIANR